MSRPKTTSKTTTVAVLGIVVLGAVALLLMQPRQPGTLPQLPTTIAPAAGPSAVSETPASNASVKVTPYRRFITLLVVSPEGAPLSGSRVTANSDPTSTSLLVTNAQGEVQITRELPPESTYSLEVVHPDYLPQRDVLNPSVASDSVVITMRRGATIFGEVHDAGASLPNATLILMGGDIGAIAGAAGSSDLSPGCRSSKSDDQGRFRFSGLSSAQDYVIRCISARRIMKDGARVVVPSTKPTIIEMEPFAVIAASLRDADTDEPIAASSATYQLQLTDPTVQDLQHRRMLIPPLASGISDVWSITRIISSVGPVAIPSRTRIELSVHGYSAVAPELPILAPDVSPSDKPVIRLRKREGVVRCRFVALVDRSEPFVGSIAICVIERRTPQGSATGSPQDSTAGKAIQLGTVSFDAHGKSAIYLLPEGAYSATCETTPSVFSVAESGAIRGILEIPLFVGRVGSLRFDVVDALGRPAPYFTYSITKVPNGGDRDLLLLQNAQTLRPGAVVIEGLQQGAYGISVRAGDFSGESEVYVTEAADRTSRIVVRRKE